MCTIANNSGGFFHLHFNRASPLVSSLSKLERHMRERGRRANQGRAFFLIKTVLNSWNRNVQRDTAMASKLDVSAKHLRNISPRNFFFFKPLKRLNDSHKL